MTALPIDADAEAMSSSSGNVSPALGGSGAGGPPRPRCGCLFLGSLMVDSRNVLDACAARSFSSLSAFETERMSCSDFAPLAISERRSILNVETMISFCAFTRSSRPFAPAPAIAPWLRASVNSCSYGFTSRKKMSLRASLGRVPRVRSRART